VGTSTWWAAWDKMWISLNVRRIHRELLTSELILSGKPEQYCESPNFSISERKLCHTLRQIVKDRKDVAIVMGEAVVYANDGLSSFIEEQLTSLLIYGLFPLFWGTFLYLLKSTVCLNFTERKITTVRQPVSSSQSEIGVHNVGEVSKV